MVNKIKIRTLKPWNWDSFSGKWVIFLVNVIAVFWFFIVRLAERQWVVTRIRCSSRPVQTYEIWLQWYITYTRLLGKKSGRCSNVLVFGADLEMPPGMGPDCLRVPGAACHEINTRWLVNQLYTDECNTHTLSHPESRGMKRGTLEALQHVLHNPYIRSYKPIREDNYKNVGSEIV